MGTDVPDGVGKLSGNAGKAVGAQAKRIGRRIMIYTLTLNPSIDYHIYMDEIIMGGVNRTEREELMPGGKGLNVSIMLERLGHESIALGFSAGFTGIELERMLKARGVAAQFVRVQDGYTRMNVKIHTACGKTNAILGERENAFCADNAGKAGQDTDINGMGPVINGRDLERMYELLSGIKDGDILVLSGSKPQSLPDTVYMEIMERLVRIKVKIVVDATGLLLANALRYKPFLIKPNLAELEEIFRDELGENKLESTGQVAEYAKKLKEKGAANVLVSMGADGAVLVSADGAVYCETAPKGHAVNAVGAGDSMVAGFLAGFLETKDYERAFRFALCTGSASAFSSDFAERWMVEKLLSACSNK